jgi:hypothetical protein
MIKNTLSSLLIFVSIINVKAQNPIGLEWQKSFGGSNPDEGKCIQQTSDGGYITIGSTYSFDGDVINNQGLTDCWIIKTNDQGIIEWQKTLGGSGNDVGNSIQQTSDGGFILVGHTTSVDGDVTLNNGYGNSIWGDIWVVKLNSLGIIQWQKTLGGSDDEYGAMVNQTNDGGYIVVGSSRSIDGDLTENHGSFDYWVIKLSSVGSIQWQKSLGGSAYDVAQSIIQSTDGGFVIVGYSASNDGNVIGNHGSSDIWVVKLSNLGIMQWQKCLGGTGSELGYSIQQSNDGGYVIAGSTASNDGDITGYHGAGAWGTGDSWVVKLNGSGLLQWQKTFGGSDDEIGHSIQQTSDGGYIVLGSTGSNDGDVFGYSGGVGWDFWIVKMNNSGTIQWQKTLGGSDDDIGYSIQQTSDGGYIFTGSSLSENGSISGSHGGGDCVVMKLINCGVASNVTINETACNTYTSSTGQTYNQSGTYQETLTNIYGCDSIYVTINLTILSNSYSSFSGMMCEGSFYSWNGQQYSQPGQYTQTLLNQYGCDSIVTLNLNLFYVSAPQVCIVGMDSLTNENRVVWEKPLTLGIDSFFVYKESDVFNVYTKIGATDYNDLAVFLDVNSNPAVQAYRYKISVLDTCGTETNVGDFHKTIHLTINQGVGGAWNLIWSHYEGLNFGSYNIYRGTDQSNISLLTTIQSNLNSYTDLTPPSGAVYYQIEIVNPVNCDPTKSINYSVSRSNIVDNGQVGFTEISSTSIQVYPNPTKDMLTLNVSNDLLGKSYTIMDFAGRIIQEGKINSSKEQIYLQAISNGSYFLQVEGKAIKVVKQ